MRKHLAALVFLAGALACSSDSRNPVGVLSPAPSPTIADAANGGREGFYFLQPIVANPKVAGPFDATIVPQARICALNTSRTACSDVILATIPTGSGPNTLAVDDKNGVFTGQWSSPASLELSTLSGSETRYRLEILISVAGRSVTLGAVDLWVIPQQREGKVSPAGFVDLVQGKNLVIRFGALPGTIGYVVVTPDPVEVDIGETQQMSAAAFDLHNAVVPSASFAWSSDDPDIAPVSSTGLATGLTRGSTSIIAKTAGVTGSAALTVVGDPPVAPTAVADEAAAESAPGDPFHAAFNTTLNSGTTTPGLLANDVRGSPPADVVSFGGGSLGGAVEDHAAGSTATFGTGGSLRVDTDGSFSFTPSNGFTGLFAFSYRIQNASGLSTASVALAVGARPSASDDAYPATIIGNVSINTATNSHFSVSTNDAGDGLTINLSASPNGNTSINADGTFTFNPAPGFSGSATFSYTVQNGFGTSPAASVTIPVTTPIWFVNASAPAGGDGRLSAPFNCVVDAGTACYDDSANEAGDMLFLFSGTYANSGALTLQDNQRIIGQGAASSLTTLSGLGNAADSPPLPATGGAVPLLTSTGGGLVLAGSNQLYGFNVGNTGGVGIAGDNFGNLTLVGVNFPGPARTGQALGLSNGTLAGGASFTTIASTSGGGAGISLVNVTGNFAVTGSGSAGSGGTISNTTGSAAIVLSNVASVSLSRMIVRDNAGHGISATTVNGFTLTQSTVQNNGDDASEANVRLTGLTGTASITSNTISTASGDNVSIDNAAGTLSVSALSNTIRNDATRPNATNGLRIAGGGTAVINATIQNNIFQGNRLAHLSVNSSNGAAVQLVASGNSMECGNALATACNASFVSGSSATFSYTIQSNLITGMKGAVELHKSSGTGSMIGTFASNTIGASGVAGSGGDGLSILSQVDGADHIAAITGNAISNYRLYGIDMIADAAGTLEATLTSNILNEPGVTAQHGVRAIAGASPTSTALFCLAISNNVLNGSGPLSDFRLAQGGLATMRLPFYVGANNNDAAVVEFVRSLQTLNDEFNPTGMASNTVATGGGGFGGGSECSTP